MSLGLQLRFWACKVALAGLLLVVLFGLTSRVNGTVDCKNKHMKCYYCDSRYEPHCQDPFNSTSLQVPEKADRNVTECNGCCVKFTYQLDDGEFLLRTCLRNMVVHHLESGSDVCMDEQFGHSELCVCVTDLCNGSRRNAGLDGQGRWFVLTGPAVLAVLGEVLRRPTMVWNS